MRVTAELAHAKAEAFLDEAVRPGVALDVTVDAEATIETERCWVFFYNTREFLETRSAKFALAGNAPIFVVKDDPGVYFGRTDVPIEDQLADVS